MWLTPFYLAHSNLDHLFILSSSADLVNAVESTLDLDLSSPSLPQHFPLHLQLGPAQSLEVAV